MREVIELYQRIAEIERKMDGMFRHGPVHERKKVDGQWHVRIAMGGTEDEPTLSPWLPYAVASGGPGGLNIHRVPTKGEQMTMLSPSGDPRQAVLIPYTWSSSHAPPTDKADAVVITHPQFRVEVENGALTVELAGPLNIRCSTFNLNGLDGSGLAMENGKLTIKADVIETDGETHLDKGSKPVHRTQDHDSHGDVAVEGAPRVFA